MRRRQLPSDNFTILSNAWLRDDTLSWAARGLLGWMASHTVGFAYTEATIIESGPMGRDGVRALIRELESAGYLLREYEYFPTGGSAVDYVLTDPSNCAPVDGLPVVRPDQAKQDVSAAQPDDGQAVFPSFTEDHEKTKIPSGSKRAAARPATGTRLPEDFQPTEEMRAWFASEKLSEAIDGRWEHDKFVDYWLSIPGTKGRKLDWPRTWRNWMRSAADRAPRRPGNSVVAYGGDTGATPYKASTTDQRVAQGLALAAQFREEENK